MRRTRRIGLTTKSDRVDPVAIVGGGASGTILAVQLARRGIRSVLIDGSGRIGRGVAYSTGEPSHLLNVRAEGMSALAGEPDHFAKCFAAEGGDPRGFAERRLFGRYLGNLLADAVASGHVLPVDASATAATRDGSAWQVALDDGSMIEATALVLAIGNQEPEPMGAFAAARRRFIGNPWGEGARSAVAELAETGADVLLVGTGLTMIDLVLSLEAAGHRGGILAVSRRGLVPRTHADNAPAPAQLEELPLGNLRAISRWLRRRSANVGWRAAVDSLRPHSHAIWQSLGGTDQRRFMRHARPWWDVHRHRIAPEVGQTVARLIGEGRLRVMAGRIVSATETADELHVEIRSRGADRPQEFAFGYGINCTGPLHMIGRTRDPLLRSLLESGLVRPDDLNLGLTVDEQARAGDHLWALGPLTKARYWEIVAVPDIREQAARVADDIERELGQ